MKILVEFFPNQDGAALHVDKRVISSTIEAFGGPEWDKEKQPLFVQKMFDVNGVNSITLQQYQVSIYKGRIFDWNDLIPQIVEVLRTDFTDDHEIEMVYSPKDTIRSIVTEALAEELMKELSDDLLEKLIELIRDRSDSEEDAILEDEVDDVMNPDTLFEKFENDGDPDPLDFLEDGEFTSEEEED